MKILVWILGAKCSDCGEKTRGGLFDQSADKFRPLCRKCKEVFNRVEEARKEKERLSATPKWIIESYGKSDPSWIDMPSEPGTHGISDLIDEALQKARQGDQLQKTDALWRTVLGKLAANPNSHYLHEQKIVLAQLRGDVAAAREALLDGLKLSKWKSVLCTTFADGLVWPGVTYNARGRGWVVDGWLAEIIHWHAVAVTLSLRTLMQPKDTSAGPSPQHGSFMFLSCVASHMGESDASEKLLQVSEMICGDRRSYDSGDSNNDIKRNVGLLTTDMATRARACLRALVGEIEKMQARQQEMKREAEERKNAEERARIEIARAEGRVLDEASTELHIDKYMDNLRWAVSTKKSRDRTLPSAIITCRHCQLAFEMDKGLDERTHTIVVSCPKCATTLRAENVTRESPRNRLVPTEPPAPKPAMSTISEYTSLAESEFIARRSALLQDLAQFKNDNNSYASSKAIAAIDAITQGMPDTQARTPMRDQIRSDFHTYPFWEAATLTITSYVPWKADYMSSEHCVQMSRLLLAIAAQAAHWLKNERAGFVDSQIR